MQVKVANGLGEPCPGSRSQAQCGAKHSKHASPGCGSKAGTCGFLLRFEASGRSRSVRRPTPSNSLKLAHCGGAKQFILTLHQKHACTCCGPVVIGTSFNLCVGETPVLRHRSGDGCVSSTGQHKLLCISRGIIRASLQQASF